MPLAASPEGSPCQRGNGQARLTASSAIQVKLPLPHRHFLSRERQLLLNNLREQWLHVRVEVAALVNVHRGPPNLVSGSKGDICWSDGVIRHHLEKRRVRNVPGRPTESMYFGGRRGNARTRSSAANEATRKQLRNPVARTAAATDVPIPVFLWGQRGSNPRPADYESAALTD